MSEEMNKVVDVVTDGEGGISSGIDHEMSQIAKSAEVNATQAEQKTAGPVAPEVAEVEPAVPDVGSAEAALIYTLESKGGLDATVALKLAQDLGIDSIDDLSMLQESDLVNAGMKVVKARKLLAEIKPEPVKKSATVAQPQPIVAPDYSSILPSVPSDDSWLASMKTGGVLKVSQDAYISAIRVVFADQAGLFDLPEKIATAMEAYAEEADEPVPQDFFKLRKQIIRHNYSEIFSAIDGLDSNYVTDKRRNEFLRRVRTELQPAIRAAFVALNSWYDSVRATNSDPSFMFTAIAGMMNGTGAVGATMPPFDAVTDASETLKDSINHVFRGMGNVVASAMAYDARQTSAVLDNPQLPAAIGVANRDQMLKKLGANVSPNYVRQEANMVRFVLSYVRFSDNVAVGEEPRYLTALWQLGNQINWDAVGGIERGPHSIGGSTKL